MRLAHCAFAVVALVALTGAARTQKAPPPAPPPRPPAVAPGEQSRILDFARIVSRVPVGAQIVHVSCDYDSRDKDRVDIVERKSGGDMNPADFRPLFFERARAEGYRLPQSEGSLFNEGDRGTDAQLAIAGAITGVFIDSCEPRGSHQEDGIGSLFALLSKRKATGKITVDWEVYDQLNRKVVLKTTTQGEGTASEKTPAQRFLAYKAAFADAATKLLIDPEFHRVATASAVSPPEAATQPEPPPATAIARLPLSTTAFQQQTDKVLGQVVTVLLGQSFGSGFYISDTLLLTNQHVVGLSQYVKVRMKSGKEMIGEVLSRDKPRDVALIKTESIGVPGLPLHIEEPGIGSQVYVIGTPLEQKLAQSVSAGIVSGFRVERNLRFIQSEANAQHGNSGGPMLDDKGNVVGLTDFGVLNEVGAASGIGLFIPIGDALKTLNVTFAGG